jgi:hypothetical protein
MQVTPKSLHGLIDYAVGALLLVGPWLFGIADHGTARTVTMAFGAAIIINSLCTDHDFGVLRRLSMTSHLLIDAACGGLLIAAPWVGGFADRSWIPHLVIGTVVAARSVAFLLGLGISDVMAPRGGTNK